MNIINELKTKELSQKITFKDILNNLNMRFKIDLHQYLRIEASNFKCNDDLIEKLEIKLNKENNEEEIILTFILKDIFYFFNINLGRKEWYKENLVKLYILDKDKLPENRLNFMAITTKEFRDNYKLCFNLNLTDLIRQDDVEINKLTNLILRIYLIIMYTNIKSEDFIYLLDNVLSKDFEKDKVAISKDIKNTNFVSNLKIRMTLDPSGIDNNYSYIISFTFNEEKYRILILDKNLKIAIGNEVYEIYRKDENITNEIALKVYLDLFNI